MSRPRHPRRSGSSCCRPILTPGASIAPHNSPRFPTRWPTELLPPGICGRVLPISRPTQIARELGLPVETTDGDPLVGSIWRFAEYRPRPPRIVLYSRGLAPLERRLTGSRAAQLLGRATPRDVFIAHELYHHIEAIRPDVPIARRYQPSLFRIGNWHWRTGIAALAEIAAGAFAQSLLDLPCHPKALDFVAVDAIAVT